MKFFEKCYLKRHMLKHSGVKPYSCCVCSKSFRTKRTLNDHMKIHTGEKLFTCTICSSSFSLKQSLKCHMKVHTGEKPYSCNICDKSYSDVRSLKHQKLTTNCGKVKNVCVMIKNINILPDHEFNDNYESQDKDIDIEILG